MEYFEQKITYLRGLCDGSGYTEDSKEGKIFHGMLDLLDDMACMLEHYNEAENDSFDTLEEDDEDEDAYFLYSFICPNCGEEIEVDEDILGENLELICPKCQNMIPVEATSTDDLKF